MKKIKVWDLLIFVVTAELGGAVSSVLSGGGFAEYYGSLIKPPLSPPGWVFPVVWAVLYALMGISAYLIYDSGSPDKQQALTVYGVQLIANMLWTPVFFGIRSFVGAAIVVCVMLVLVARMIAVFYKTDKRAAYLNIPYLAWTLFAAYLTFGTLLLNK